ncbi:hypothetical protein AB0B44_39170, partial [Streptomyces sp. NPDC041003]
MTTRTPRAWASKAAVNTVLIMLALYTLMPISWLLIAATKNRRDLFATSGFAFREFNLFSNIHDVFTHNDGIYGRWLLNTVLYAVVGSALSAYAAEVRADEREAAELGANAVPFFVLDR